MSEVSKAEFDALKAEVASLKAELAKASKALAKIQAEEPIPEDHLAVIAAAIAAYTGKRAAVRYIRRAPGSHHESWRTQGRVTIAASHKLPSTKGW